MVSKNRGLHDWWIQRLSALLISAFVLPTLFFWLVGWLPDAAAWYDFLMIPWVKGLTLLGLTGVLLHSWIGLWVVATDYVPRRIQGFVLGFLHAWLSAYYLIGIYLIWSL